MNTIKLSNAAGRFVPVPVILMLLLTVGVSAQDTVSEADTTRTNAVRVFLDCRFCDLDYMKKEIPYINYVRDIRESQLYLLISSQQASSGGTHVTLFFSGREEFAGMTDTLYFNTYPDDTDDMRRSGL
ncbi:MAG: hypothetical protein JXA61_06345, partial [Bacteroidales bacterium]|nr:hypothetical protein [Bacteroidales bacterium]